MQGATVGEFFLSNLGQTLAERSQNGGDWLDIELFLVQDSQGVLGNTEPRELDDLGCGLMINMCTKQISKKKDVIIRLRSTDTYRSNKQLVSRLVVIACGLKVEDDEKVVVTGGHLGCLGSWRGSRC